ncbi:hypothetical protein O3M35_011154 [Rhynocoris fuscipes]|uniref:Carboxylic ester hydrolase n=1 Tax=Rhynocoris fuscipes TaxID=488301 RepID=A0AAW1D1Z0_9HEMI
MNVLQMYLMCNMYFSRCGEFQANTTEGPVTGFQIKSRTGRNFMAFGGIPYAKPPVGELRFEDPQPPEKRNKIREGVWIGPRCLQSLYVVTAIENVVQGQEDCLYLSIATHNLNPPKLYPVLVHLHGGNYDRGYGQRFVKPQYFMDYDVVVVSMDFRLGIQGFLSTEDEVLPGNYGLKDQSMALKWIRKNIKNFGGDPNRITIYGESSGGSSVHHQMISPWSKGLFNQGIMESGTAVSTWDMLPKGFSRQRTITVAKELGCPTNSSQLILACLKTVDSKELTRIIKIFRSNLIESKAIFTPVVDSYSRRPFLPKDPHYLKVPPVPLMMVVADLDGMVKSAYFTKEPGYYNELDKNFPELIRNVLFTDVNTISKSTANRIRKFYLGDKPVSPATVKNITDIITDSWFIWPSLTTLMRHSGPHYLLLNAYDAENTMQYYFGGGKILNGATHMDIGLHIWDDRPGIIFDRPADLEFSKLLVNLWTNFITYGTPAPPGFKYVWPKWDEVQQRYLRINNEGVTVEKKIFEERMRFWSTIFKN